MLEVPRHVAIIMDGNGRWAKQRNLPKIMGHKKGVEVVDIITEECAKEGVEALTLYTFSSENWKRPKEEVEGLMLLLKQTLDKKIKKLSENNIRFNCIGKMSELNPDLAGALAESIKKTSKNTGMILTLALNYGAQRELLDTVKSICNDVANGELSLENLDEKKFEEYLYTYNLPPLDLVIRTSGEMRISNFLLWQSAYSEFYFTDILWPDFGPDQLKKAFAEYKTRQRRFGG